MPPRAMASRAIGCGWPSRRASAWRPWRRRRGRQSLGGVLPRRCLGHLLQPAAAATSSRPALLEVARGVAASTFCFNFELEFADLPIESNGVASYSASPRRGGTPQGYPRIAIQSHAGRRRTRGRQARTGSAFDDKTKLSPAVALYAAQPSYAGAEPIASSSARASLCVEELE